MTATIETTELEIKATRIFNAPRKLVFQAWTEPKHLARWWGPKGCTNTIHTLDLRPGGAWRFVMHGPDGTDYPNHNVFVEVVKPERLVIDHVSKPAFQMTATFVEENGQTTVGVRMRFATAADRDLAVNKFGAVEGLNQTLGRLGELVATMSAVPHEVVLTRVFAAPRELVFRAWTDPKHLARWWGPKGFTNPVCEVDARPGGRLRIDMAGPDGSVHPMKGTFHEIAAPERLVFTSTAFEDAAGVPQLEVRNTVTFAEHDGQTTLTVHVVVVKSTPGLVGALAGMEAGWSQSLDKLAADLPGGTALDAEFVVSRVFDAPRELVFQAWTATEHLTRWFGPKGCTTSAAKNDPRPGGAFHYCMKTPAGQAMWGLWVYIGIVPPERLVFVASFADEAGNIVRAPFHADWPLKVLSCVSFTERDGKTTVTMRGEPINASDAERRAFLGGHASMQQGWTGTLDQLAEYLAKA